ncbi:RHS repeat-associated core domain-containing protein [Sorangium cellulosum]|uniref:RHS repeat-associated core domain-containing protein n=1 Tax=Sorangium cellulosum TaxID=56 RepID=UPI0004155175|nr:RHS repeat-associated core domain-containing protein [Sorangium cellulosum]
MRCVESRLDPGESARLPCGVLTRYPWGYALAAGGLAYLLAEARGGRWLLSRIVDLHDNLIELSYEDGRLAHVIDSVGRVVRARRHKDGRIAAFEVKNATAQGRWEARRRYAFDARGDLVAAEDAAGHAHRFAYDEDHRLLRREEPGGLVAEFRYKDGRCVEAWCHRDGNDALANRVRVVEPDGAERRIRYDFLGRVVGFTDEAGHETRYAYDACGRLCAVFGPGGAVTRHDFDADGNLAKITDADGRTTTLRWGGFHVVTELVRPDGTRVLYRYDREQDLVRIVNEAGDEHRIQRDGEGRITGERTFDGREIAYRLDLQGRIAQMRCGPATVDFEYDAVGRLVKRATSDGREDVFDYDPLGRLERAASGDVECVYSYDRRGRVLTEVTRRGGEELAAFAWTYDAMGKAIGVRGPGGEVAVQRDVVGRPVAALVGDEREPLRLAYDARGFEVERVLPGGGTIATEVNADRLLARQSVLGKPATPRIRPGEPPWVGPLVAPATWRRTYAWSPAGLLRAAQDRGGATGEMLRDANGRVIERRRAGKAAERFRFTAAGDLERADERRTYAPGGRLTARAAGREIVRYEHGERGDVVRKRVTGSGAAGEQERERVWAYAWSGDGRLMEARTPEGRTIAFAYDAFGRRIEKRVARMGEVESVTRYAWRGGALVHERRERADGAGARIVEERSYVTLPESALPLAQRDGAAGALRYFVHGVNGFPEALVEGDGSVAAELGAGLYGEVPAEHAALTPLRFPGQYADEETGLYYNGHRYYDPETGTYLSPEPIGLEGSLKAYAYVDNWPTELVDPDALAKMHTEVAGTYTGKNGKAGSLTREAHSGQAQRERLHPAVQAALPPTPARPPGSAGNPEDCSEPKALSDYLNRWEEKTGKSCHPDDPNWQNHLQEALGGIESIKSYKGSNKDSLEQACPNCTQTIARLWSLAGLPPPGSKVPGGGTRFAPADPKWNPAWSPGKSDAQSPTTKGTYKDKDGNVVQPGAWHHDGSGWVKL